MGLVDRVLSFFPPSKLDVAKRFELLRAAVHGTMSSFYQARDRRTDEIVGLKICDLEKTSFFENRFTGLSKPSEGQVASQFDHPLIVKTFEFGVTTDDEQYLVMEYLYGSGMNSYILQKSHLLEGKRLMLVRQMAEALQIVHDAGYIHRDVCPRNFICLEEGQSLKLIDFGLTVPATKEFMKPGNRTGTPNYMAPEILRRRATDHRLDIFAFGVTAYQLCSWQLPWPGQEVSGKAAVRHDTESPIDLLSVAPHLNPALAQVIMRCMSVNPTDRPQSFSDVLRDVRSIESETV